MLICHVSIVAKNGQTKRRLWRRPLVFLAATIRDSEASGGRLVAICNLSTRSL